MDRFDIWVLMFLVLTAPGSLAYPFNTMSQSLTLASSKVISQVSPKNILRSQDKDAVKESKRSLLTNLQSCGRDIQRGLLHTTPNFEPSTGDCDVNQSTESPPDVGMEKRASEPQQGSSLLTSTQSLKPGGTLSTLNLIVPATDHSESVKTPPANRRVYCFDPRSADLKPALADDCDVVINDIILRYPDPMSPKTFGYRPSADIDLSLPANEQWIYDSCTIFVRNVNKTRTDTFRMVDVAITAQNIVKKCLVGAKYPLGGFSDVGPTAGNFFLGVGAPHYE